MDGRSFPRGKAAAMSLLAHGRIIAKIIGLIGLIAAVVAGDIYFSTGRMRQIDDAYSQFIARDAEALVMSARMRRATYQLWMHAYQIIAETDPSKVKKAEAGIEQMLGQLAEYAAAIRSDMPASAGSLEAIAAKTARLKAVLPSMVKHALANRSHEAVAVMEG